MDNVTDQANPTLDQILASANEVALAKLRADCTDELCARVYSRLGHGVRVSSAHIAAADVNERDLYCMEAAGLARLDRSFVVMERVTNCWTIFFAA